MMLISIFLTVFNERKALLYIEFLIILLLNEQRYTRHLWNDESRKQTNLKLEEKKIDVLSVNNDKSNFISTLCC